MDQLVDFVSLFAGVEYDEQLMLYYSINTTAAVTTTTEFDIDREQSWEVLKEIEEVWSAYIL